MQTLYTIVLTLAVIVAALFGLMVLVTGKGDAMSGGGSSIRTTYRGKATLDDQIQRVTMILGGVFLVSCIVLDAIAHNMK